MKTALLPLLLALIFVGCAKSGFQLTGTTDPTQTGQGPGNGQPESPTQTLDKQWSNLATELNGTGSNMIFEKFPFIKIDQARKAIVLIFPPIPLLGTPQLDAMDLSRWVAGAKLIPLTVNDGQADVKTWAVIIPLQAIKKAAQLVPVDTLPNGEPIPFVVGPCKGIRFVSESSRKYSLKIYICDKSAAAFIELNDINLTNILGGIDVTGRSTMIFSKSTGQNVGYYEIKLEQAKSAGGLFMGLRFGNRPWQILDYLSTNDP